MIHNEEFIRDCEKRHRRGKVAGGLFVVIAGSLFLGRELGAQIPHWIFTWQSLIIAIGLVGFIKHGFSRFGWMLPILIGGAFLLGDLYPDMIIRDLLWPIVLIVVGLFIMFKPRHNSKHWQKWRERKEYYRQQCDVKTESSNENFIDSTSVMGGIKKNILSKTFKGGDITNIFGGTELNLTQADFSGSVTLDITQVFGGTKLIIPAHWQIQSNNSVAIMGSIEDKRPVGPTTGSDTSKILILNGTTIFGGIDIKTY